MEVKRGAPGGEAAVDFERSPTRREGRGLFACGRGEGKRWGLDFFLLQGSSSATVDCQLSTTAPKPPKIPPRGLVKRFKKV